MDKKLKILFLCTGNSCRSQMAEGWTKALKSDEIEAVSAGIETHGLNPNAVKVMEEAGVDITSHKSQNITDFKDETFDYVITVCGHAHETCPFFPGDSKVVHKGFDDPPKMALEVESEEDKLNCYRTVRDEIKEFVKNMPKNLKELEKPEAL
jgi:arsenate reductase